MSEKKFLNFKKHITSHRVFRFMLALFGGVAVLIFAFIAISWASFDREDTIIRWSGIYEEPWERVYPDGTRVAQDLPILAVPKSAVPLWLNPLFPRQSKKERYFASLHIMMSTSMWTIS